MFRFHLPTILFPLMLLWVAGCATVPTYHGPRTAQAVTLKGKNANAITKLFTGEATVTFAQVDGLRVVRNPFSSGIGNDAIRVDPGTHFMTVDILGSTGKVGTGEMDIDAKAGHSYLFTAKRQGENFALILWDDTAGHGSLTSLNERTVLAKPGNFTMPILVPGR